MLGAVQLLDREASYRRDRRLLRGFRPSRKQRVPYRGVCRYSQHQIRTAAGTRRERYGRMRVMSFDVERTACHSGHRRGELSSSLRPETSGMEPWFDTEKLGR